MALGDARGRGGLQVHLVQCLYLIDKKTKPNPQAQRGEVTPLRSHSFEWQKPRMSQQWDVTGMGCAFSEH